MKKWILITTLSIVIIIGITIKVYFKAVEPVRTAEERAISIAEQQTDLKTTDDFYLYNGTESYSVITGTNSKGQKVIIWVPDKDENIYVRRASEGITREKALQKLYDEKKPSEVIYTRLGIEYNRPLWEINYRNDQDLLNYYYIDFVTGEELKDIENL
ncbi:cell wall elongation regulator TseB-like domain-containing protein [Bacillus massilinigeriensis]|uniref:cell wall elongation regulator TseB-like domain-containing protein n=1 Tax=Bacillus massilionigeriensis TaxID=1805475 RepID=UPI00096B5567|nr:DUF5590 domain-containing protein [Bacillus massilionigeriensis]